MKGYKNKEELQAVYYELRSMNKVASHYGVSKKLILNHIKKFGIEPIDHRKHVDVNELRRLVSEGKRVFEIEKCLGISNATLCKIAKQEGIKTDFFHKGYTQKDSGYILIRKPDHPRADKKGYVPEHVLVMEGVIGRYLQDNEIVHHKNRNKSDNSPENLVLLDRYVHKSFHSSEIKKEVDLDAVMDLLDKGYFFGDICIYFGVAETTLRKRLHKAGLYRRLPPKVNQYSREKYIQTLSPLV